MIPSTDYPLTSVEFTRAKTALSNVVHSGLTPGSTTVQVALKAFSEYLRQPHFGVPFLNFTASLADLILRRPQAKPIRSLRDTYKGEVEANKGKRAALQSNGLTGPSDFFRKVLESIKPESNYPGPTRQKLQLVLNSLEQTKSDVIISIATSLSQSENQIFLLQFLSNQDIEEFKHPMLREVLVSSFGKVHTLASPVNHEIFWNLAKKIVYSFCPDPDSLEILIEGGSVGNINFPSLLSLHAPATLFVFFQDILPLVQTSAPAKSIEIITKAKEASRQAIFLKIQEESLSPRTREIFRKRSPSPIGHIPFSPIPSPPPELR